MQATRICVISGAPPNINDAVGDFAWLLAKELALEYEVSLIVPKSRNMADSDGISMHRVNSGWGYDASEQVRGVIDRIKPEVILVHFVPQLYGWNGAKPMLAILLFALKRSGYTIVTIAHEFSSPLGPSPKLMLWASAHQLLLRFIVRASRGIVVTNKLYLDILKRQFPRRSSDFHCIPVGCALPVIAMSEDQKQQLREQLAIGDGELVVSTFGSAVESIAAPLENLFDWFLRDGWAARFLIIGKSGEALRRKLSRHSAIAERMIVTGPVSNEGVSNYLSISDLYVIFYADGASTRRTSLMVGLAHGVPTISNTGILTDSLLASSGALYLMNGTMKDYEAEMLRQLCANSGERKRLGEKARAFFDENFSWERIGTQYRRVIEESSAK